MWLFKMVLFIFMLFQELNAVGEEWMVNISSSTSSHFEFWFNQCVGSGHASLALREDWQQKIKYVHDELGMTSVRMHGILDDDVGFVNGINDYSFVNGDKIYDYLLSINMKPYVEISFMPEAFASSDCKILHYNANVTPPKNYTIWNDFIKQWMTHLVSRYGINEVSKWRFEVWNEPNDKFFEQTSKCSSSSLDDYLKLYSNTANSIKSVSSELKVGGPSTNNPSTWMNDFLNQTIIQNIPIDFVATHSYPSNQQNNLNWWYNTLNNANNEINKFKQYQNIEVLLSEFNSGLFQWNQKYDNHDSIYASSFMIFMIKQIQPLLSINNNTNHYKWLSYWAFSDIFEESGFDSSPFWLNNNVKNKHFGMITIRGINKPVFNAMNLVYKYGSNISYFTNSMNNKQTNIMIYCLKNRMNDNRYSIYISNFANYGSTINNQTININVTQNINNNLKLPKSAMIFRIDQDNTNPLAKWINMGKPMYPANDQFNTLNESAQLVPKTIAWKEINSNIVQFTVLVPSYGVAMIDIQY